MPQAKRTSRKSAPRKKSPARSKLRATIPPLTQWEKGPFKTRQLAMRDGGLYTIGKLSGQRLWTASHISATGRGSHFGKFATAREALATVRHHHRYLNIR